MVNGATYDSIVRLFRLWDADGSGSVTRAELARLMRFVTNGSITEPLIDKLMAAADTNGDGQIQLEEFISWIYDPKKGMFSRDVNPSSIHSSKSPAMVAALQEWFDVVDMNHNGVVEYEEFALACLTVNPEAKAKDIDADFNHMDANGNRAVTWPEFLVGYSQLLDAIPRPIEEKIQMMRGRAADLARKIKEKPQKDGPQMITSSKDFLQVLRSQFNGSIVEAFQALDVDCDKSLTVVELKDALERVLPKGIRLDIQGLRTVFRELDMDHSGTITLEELEQALAPRKPGGAARAARSGGGGRGPEAAGAALPPLATPRQLPALRATSVPRPTSAESHEGKQAAPRKVPRVKRGAGLPVVLR